MKAKKVLATLLAVVMLASLMSSMFTASAAPPVVTFEFPVVDQAEAVGPNVVVLTWEDLNVNWDAIKSSVAKVTFTAYQVSSGGQGHVQAEPYVDEPGRQTTFGDGNLVNRDVAISNTDTGLSMMAYWSVSRLEQLVFKTANDNVLLTVNYDYGTPPTPGTELIALDTAAFTAFVANPESHNYLRLSGSPTVSIDGDSLKVSNRTEDWYAIDVLLGSLNLKEYYKYRLTAIGPADLVLQFPLDAAPWSTGAGTKYATGKTYIEFPGIMPVVNGVSQTDGGFRIRVLSAGTTDYVIDSILIEEIEKLWSPVITIGTQPTATTGVSVGEIVGNLSVAATVTGGVSLSYQWYSNTEAKNTGGTAITGATSASFTIPTTLTVGNYYYYCVVSATDAASVTTNVACVEVVDFSVVTFLTQPATTTEVLFSKIVESLTVSANVSKGGTPAYQWYSNTEAKNTGGTKINGATNASFPIPKDLAVGTYYYYCVVGSTDGKALEVASNVATVKVLEYTPIIEEPGEWKMGDAMWKIDAAVDDFIKILDKDGKDVNSENYEIKAGSTIIVMKEAFVASLGLGEHKFKAVFKGDLEVELVLKVVEIPKETTYLSLGIINADNGNNQQGWEIKGDLAEKFAEAIYFGFKLKVSAVDDMGGIGGTQYIFHGDWEKGATGFPAENWFQTDGVTPDWTAKDSFALLSNVTLDGDVYVILVKLDDTKGYDDYIGEEGNIYLGHYGSNAPVFFAGITEGFLLFEGVPEDTSPKAKEEKQAYDPEKGGDVKWIIENADIADFVGLKLGDKELKKDEEYKAEAGSIIITLFEDFVKTLDADKTHTFTAIVLDENGDEVEISLVLAISAPKTGVNGNLILWLSIAGCSLVGAVGAAYLLLPRRRGNKA